MGIEQVEFCSDSKAAIDTINSEGEDISERGIIAQSCQIILKARPGFKVIFIRRERNVVAHNLARLSKNFVSTYVWDDLPADIEGLLRLPCICN